MATALKILPAPAVCEHATFVAYERDGSSTDDTVTEKGRCVECGGWLALWYSRSTAEIFDERLLSNAEIRALREQEMEP